MKMFLTQLVISSLILAIMVYHSSASYCVCKSGLQSTAYQTAIDYACGQGVDCSPIGPNGQCSNSNGIQGRCSFVANSYYQKNSAKGATCDFQGAAQLTNSDPSGGGCSFSSTSGSGITSNGTTTTPGTTVPTTSPTTPTTSPVSGGGGSIMPITPVSGTGTPTPGTSTGSPTSSTGTSTNPTTTSPYPTGNSTSTGVLGGGMGMAPTVSSMDNHGGNRIWNMSLWSVLSALVISTIACI